MCFKMFRHRKLQSLMMGLIIMLCTTLVCGSVCIMCSLGAPYENLRKECDSYDVRIYPYVEDEATLTAFQNNLDKLDIVQDTLRLDVFNDVTKVEVNGESVDDFLCLTRYDKKMFEKVRVIEGNHEDLWNLKGNECFVPSCYSDEHNVHIGDKIIVSCKDKPHVYVVKGVFADPYDISLAFDINMIVAQLPDNVSQELGSQLMVRTYNQEDADQVEEKYREQNNGIFAGYVETCSETLEDGMLAINLVGGIFLGIGVVVLFAGNLIVFYVIRNTLNRDAKKIATLKTIGYTNGRIERLYLSFYGILASVFCLMGIGAAKVLADILLSSTFRALGAKSNINVLIPGIGCFVVVCGISLTIIFLTLRKSQNIKPIYAMNPLGSGMTKKRHKKKGNSKWQFSSFGIAMRLFSRNKRGAVGLIVISVVTIFLINFGTISLDVAYNMAENNDFWYGIERFDLFVTTNNKEQAENVINLLQQQPEVEKAYDVYYSEKLMFKWKKGQSMNIVAGHVYHDFDSVACDMVEGRNPKTKNEIALGSKVADSLDKTIGDSVTLVNDHGEQQDYLITGLFQTYYSMGKTARIRLDGVERLHPVNERTEINVYLKKGTDQQKFIDKMHKKLGSNYVIQPRRDIFQNITNMIITPQKQAIPGVVVIVVLIGAINIFSIILLKNHSLRKDFTIYKSIGYSTWHLLKANLYYVGMIAVGSVALTVPIIMATYPTIMKICLAVFKMKRYPVRYTPWVIIVSNVGALIIFAVATLLSSRSIKKIDVRELVSE